MQNSGKFGLWILSEILLLFFLLSFFGFYAVIFSPLFLVLQIALVTVLVYFLKVVLKEKIGWWKADREVWFFTLILAHILLIGWILFGSSLLGIIPGLFTSLSITVLIWLHLRESIRKEIRYCHRAVNMPLYEILYEKYKEEVKYIDKNSKPYIHRIQRGAFLSFRPTGGYKDFSDFCDDYLEIEEKKSLHSIREDLGRRNGWKILRRAVSTYKHHKGIYPTPVKKKVDSILQRIEEYEATHFKLLRSLWPEYSTKFSEIRRKFDKIEKEIGDIRIRVKKYELFIELAYFGKGERPSFQLYYLQTKQEEERSWTKFSKVRRKIESEEEPKWHRTVWEKTKNIREELKEFIEEKIWEISGIKSARKQFEEKRENLTDLKLKEELEEYISSNNLHLPYSIPKEKEDEFEEKWV